MWDGAIFKKPAMYLEKSSWEGWTCWGESLMITTGSLSPADFAISSLFPLMTTPMSHGPPPTSFFFQSALEWQTPYSLLLWADTGASRSIIQQEVAGGEREGLSLIHLVISKVCGLGGAQQGWMNVWMSEWMNTFMYVCMNKFISQNLGPSACESLPAVFFRAPLKGRRVFHWLLLWGGITNISQLHAPSVCVSTLHHLTTLSGVGVKIWTAN